MDLFYFLYFLLQNFTLMQPFHPNLIFIELKKSKIKIERREHHSKIVVLPRRRLSISFSFFFNFNNIHYFSQ